MAFHLGKLKFQQRTNFLLFYHWDIKILKEKVSKPAACVKKQKSFDANFSHIASHKNSLSPQCFPDFKILISRLFYQSHCKLRYGLSMLTTTTTTTTGDKQNNFSKSDFKLKRLYFSRYNQLGLMIMSGKRHYCNQIDNISQKSEKKKDKSHTQAGPSQENLAKIQERLKLLVIDMFKNQHDYGALHKDIIMENNLFGTDKKRIGVLAYAVELMKLRLRIHFHYPGAYCVVEDIKLFEGSNNVIRIQWKLQGVPQKHIIKFWRLQEPLDHSDIECLNGFSYFHIGSDGLIHKHRLEKIPLRPKNEENGEKKKDHSVPFLG